MVMTWDHEATLKLLVGLIGIADVKVTGEMYRKLAHHMGPECTPKAIMHKLATIKKSVAEMPGTPKHLTLDTGLTSINPTTDATTGFTSINVTAAATMPSKRKRGRPVKTAGDGEAQNGEPPKRKTKRVKSVKVEHDEAEEHLQDAEVKAEVKIEDPKSETDIFLDNLADELSRRLA